jgi:cathepsin L
MNRFPVNCIALILAAACGSSLALPVTRSTAPVVTWASLPHTNKTTYTFDHFVREFTPQFADEAERTYRRDVFNENLAKIHAHNSATPRRSFTMGVNKFAAMTAAEFRQYYRGHSASMSETFQAEPVDLSSHVPVEDLPASIDWRDKKVVTPAKNQGACGSCWAFSTAETLESHIAIKTGKLFKFAPQQFVSCVDNVQKCGGTGGCEGATQWLGFNYSIGAGITTEESYPYTASDSKCDKADIKPVATIKGYVRLPKNNYSALMNAVATIGPIAISAAAEPWQLYESGVFDQACGTDVDHAIQLVGYGGSSTPGPSPSPPSPPSPGDCTSIGDKGSCLSEGCHWCNYLGSDFCMSEKCPNTASSVIADGGAYWLVRNSWGAGWGEQGYIRIARYGQTSQGEPCATDTKPLDGTGCKGGPSSFKVCGLCGLMSDSSYPTGGALV